MDKFIEFMEKYGWLIYSIIGILNLIFFAITSIFYISILNQLVH